MMDYKKHDLLCIAKRYGNKKRGYLLVNPLQAKHVPVNPQDALAMMRTLGEKIVARYGKARAVIAFAETATAIGAVVARVNRTRCLYMATTRETHLLNKSRHWLTFAEEHSHAVTQRLFAAKLNIPVQNNYPLIFVDDEISTGRTLLNIAEVIRARYAECRERPIVAASIINRQSAAERQVFAENGIDSISLLDLPKVNYEKQVAKFTVAAPEKLPPLTNDDERTAIFADVRYTKCVFFAPHLPDPRIGVMSGKYYLDYRKALRSDLRRIADELPPKGRILLLGMEECMMPSLLLGEEIAKLYPNAQIFCHATTRSPIGIADFADYPIRNGYVLPSFYDDDRTTYLYNLDAYDIAIVWTDAPIINDNAATELMRVLKKHGTPHLMIMGGA